MRGIYQGPGPKKEDAYQSGCGQDLQIKPVFAVQAVQSQHSPGKEKTQRPLGYGGQAHTQAGKQNSR